jgi:hypothetical protein
MGFAFAFTTGQEELYKVGLFGETRKTTGHYFIPSETIYNNTWFYPFKSTCPDFPFLTSCEIKSTLVTTHRPFDEEDQVFPNTASVA